MSNRLLSARFARYQRQLPGASSERQTVRSYIKKELEPPAYKKRPATPGVVDPFVPYLRDRLAAFPGLTGVRLWRELKERGFAGGYSVVPDCVRELAGNNHGSFHSTNMSR